MLAKARTVWSLPVCMECQTAIAVKDGIGEGLYPFAKNGQVASVAQLLLLQYVEMSVDEMRDVRML